MIQPFEIFHVLRLGDQSKTSCLQNNYKNVDIDNFYVGYLVQI